MEKQFSCARVLVVEDDRMIQRIAAVMLQRLGCQVDLASDGIEALQALLDCDYQLVFMDCLMPKMDGYQTTAAIRENEKERGKHQIIIAMTANNLPGDNERCLAAGMDDQIRKPLQLADYRAKLARWLPQPEQQSSDSEPLPLFDATILSQLIEGLDEGDIFLSELLETFYDNTYQVLERLRERLAAQDREGIRLAAHNLKGASSSVGAISMATLCQRIESEAYTMKIELLNEELIKLTTQFNNFQKHLATVNFTNLLAKTAVGSR